ncbi:hypothetical protein N24_2013 [Corynebacterium suranareeae]|uniref:Uncharacterized protein n=1 Tax=Corynebacterium suranareeae TaxID=2506452 RepID=A0A160PRR5_9CORY|nr:hypothetical protein [Corynebacterium suranareeae]BAU96275.1 hypothetical protein N24_2013 [Corynebacterium suranareeae]
MGEQLPFANGSRSSKLPLFVIGICCLLLILWLKLPGILLATIIAVATFSVMRMRTSTPEVSSLRTSIRLSSEDITDVQNEWQQFLNSPDADALADRTMARPALADPDCGDAAIEKFHYEISNANRFLGRLEARLHQNLLVSELETLLKVTDERALELRETWLDARKAALKLGPNYKRGA